MKVNKLGDIACFSQGIQVAIDKQYNKIEEGYVRFLRIIDYTQNKDEIRYIDNPGERYLVNNNDVVMIRYGDAGKVVKGYEGAIANNLFKICIDEKLIIREYLYYYLSQENIYKQLTNSQQKTGLPAVNFKTVSEIKIVYPESIAIQKNIVKILDKAQELIDKRKEQIGELDKLIKSQFIEMFGDPINNPKEWDKYKFIDIVDKECTICYGIVQTGDEQKEGIPVFRPIDITGGKRPKRSELKMTTEEISNQYKRTLLNGDELLLTVRGNVGDVLVIDEEFKGCNVGRNITPIRVNEEILNIKFLEHLLKTSAIRGLLKRMSKGIALQGLNMQELRLIQLILPPIDIQNQFADFVKQVDKLKFEMEKSLKELEDNFNSLMQKAFKGELFN